MPQTCNLIYLKCILNLDRKEEKVTELQPPVATLYSSEDAAPLANSNSNSLIIDESTPKEQVKFHIPTAYDTQQSTQFLSSSSKSEPGLTKNEAEAVNAVLNDNNNNSNSNMNTLLTSSSLVFAKKQPDLMMRPSSKTLLSNLTSKSVATAPSPMCGHHNSGQELCYLCHQRQRRNVPVYLHEEMKLKDKEESQLLMQYQHLKDMERQLKDEDNRKGQRFDRAKIDAFNLGVSEAVKAKRLERPKTSDVPVSLICKDNQ